MLPGAPGALVRESASQARERGPLRWALIASRGKISGQDGAANRVGMPASTLEFRIKKMGIRGCAFAAAPENELSGEKSGRSGRLVTANRRNRSVR